MFKAWNSVPRVRGPLLIAACVGSALLAAGCSSDDDDDGDADSDEINYQVWASDQSNSVADIAAAGTRGSYLWIWNSDDLETQIAGGEDAPPLSCLPATDTESTGPCDLLDVFPQNLVELDAQGSETGQTLGQLDGFGRLHGMLADPQNRYVNANIFAPGGGYIGVIDILTREAIGLFRVTGTNVGGGTDVRSVHMSYWSADGSSILIANLNGKVLERIDVTRDAENEVITSLEFNRSASLGVGKNQQVTKDATVFSGNNAFGRPLIGSITGSYEEADFDDLTPNGVCKENGCEAGADGALGGRPNNVIICPIASTGDHGYVTMGGGGLLVADITTTPMTIVGEYGNQVINGAGCGGIQVDDAMWINAGVSASPAGATQSVFTIYTLSDSAFDTPGNPENTPMPITVFKDSGNTATGGNMDGDMANESGQLPAVTTRRDSHGMEPTLDGSHVHAVDRIANVVEVFDRDYNQTTYDLSSEDGRGNGDGPCMARSVSDDPGLPANDAAPDLMDLTPDGKYMVIAFRGPAPVSVNHSAQGSCPGVGVVEITDGGAYGRLVTVLTTTNTVDTTAANAPNGHAYTGAERSDVHGAIAVRVP